MSYHMPSSTADKYKLLPSTEHGHRFPPVDAGAVSLRTVSTPVVFVLAVTCGCSLLVTTGLVEVMKVRTHAEIVLTT